jgi:hypothetical protein
MRLFHLSKAAKMVLTVDSFSVGSFAAKLQHIATSRLFRRAIPTVRKVPIIDTLVR